MLLQAVLSPQDLSALRAALATEAMGGDAATLASSMDPEDALACAWLHEAHDQMAAWSTRWHHHGIAPMLMAAFEQLGLARRMLTKPDGERRMTNWLHLVELLHEASEAQSTPAALLRWLLAEMQTMGRQETATLRLESDRELVQIVTVHRAKGLQWPVVFAPFLWAEGRPQSTAGPLSYHDEDGRHVLDFRKDLVSKEEANAVSAKVKQEAAQQQLRLIYVALTRAVHRCVLAVDTQARFDGGGKRDNGNQRSKLNWIVAGAGLTLDNWLEVPKAPKGSMPPRLAQIDAAWRAVAQTAGPQAMAIFDLPVRWPRLRVDLGEDKTSVVPRIGPGPIRAAWQQTSFSAWMAHAAPDPAQALLRQTTPREAPTDLSPSDILHFPRGAAAGDALHAVLERVDFSAPATWPPAVAHALRMHPRVMAEVFGDPAPEAQAEAMLMPWLADLAQATLTPTGLHAMELAPATESGFLRLQLAQVARSDRLNEWAFDLRLHEGRLGSLVSWMATQGLGMPKLDPQAMTERFRGHLRGVMDMVFKQHGRYHLVDWKSNHLGWQRDDYAHASMNQAMVDHGYHLQHVIYAVALRRHLQRKLGRHDVDHVWGGALVCFVRGLRPDWIQADGNACGVMPRRLSSALLDEAATCLGLLPWDASGGQRDVDLARWELDHV
jgi:exodeoxyribonuclease V beta subunit